MTQMNDSKGCSTCQRGEEKHEKFLSRITGRWMVAYDYRAPNGELFSVVARDLETCRAKRDAWLEKQVAK